MTANDRGRPQVSPTDGGPDALRDSAAAWLASAWPAVVVQVLSARGSVPREAGTRMLVGRQQVLGSIGGGHLEWQAIADARALLATWDGGAADSASRDALQRHVALGPSLGQCCGGALVLRLAPLTAVELAAWPTAAPRFTLQLYGAGHVGRAVVQLLAGIACRVQWIDERASELQSHGALPRHIERVCAEPVQCEVAAAPPGCFYLVLTHSHALDIAIAEAILRRGDFGFFGLIGSKTKRSRFVHRLLDRGVGAAALQRMVCPIGVPGIAGKQPEVIAIAVVAQLLQQAAAGVAAGAADDDPAATAAAVHRVHDRVPGTLA